MSLINCEVNLILTWSAKCDIADSTSAEEFKLADTKLFIPLVTLSAQDNTKPQQLKSGFKRTINWNKHLSKVSTQAQNQFDTRFQGANRPFNL